jgi:hypothetical protein
MSHTYVVTSNTYTPGVPGPDPLVTIEGTVDGVPVTIQLWKSAYDQARLVSLAALEALVAPLMLAQAVQNQPPAPVAPVNQITGTFVL